MSDFTAVTGSLLSRDGLQLFYRKYESQNPVGGVVLAHGLGEHSGRHEPLARFLFSKGFSFWAIDHRGHGKSGGKQGHVASFDQYIMDLQIVVELARQELGKEKKLFLIGHSMGGLIAINFAIGFGKLIDGLVVSSPALGMTVKVPFLKEKLGKFMSNILPGLTLSNELDKEKISHDREVVMEYDNDPLVHDKVSARWFTEFMASMEKANNRAGKIDVPVLMQVAGDDYLVNAPASKEFFSKLSVKDKTLHFYDGLYHEVYNEKREDREKVLNDLVAWLGGMRNDSCSHDG